MKRILEEVLKEQRGRGQGVGGPRQGDGGAKYCVCPGCGYKEEHSQRGVSCNQIKCPNCGEYMIGSNGEEEEVNEDKDKKITAEEARKAVKAFSEQVERKDTTISELVEYFKNFLEGYFGVEKEKKEEEEEHPFIRGLRKEARWRRWLS